MSKDLWSDSGEFLYFVSGPGFTPDNCVPILTQVHDKLFNVSSSYFDQEITGQYLADIIQNIFKGRVALRDRLAEFSREGRLTPECVDAVRGVSRAARFIGGFPGRASSSVPGSPTPIIPSPPGPGTGRACWSIRRARRRGAPSISARSCAPGSC